MINKSTQATKQRTNHVVYHQKYLIEEAQAYPQEAQENNAIQLQLQEFDHCCT